MDRIGRFWTLVDQSLNTKERRHLAGGILMSFAMLFGGLAITVLTIKNSQESKEKEYTHLYSKNDKQRDCHKEETIEQDVDTLYL